MLTKEQIIQNIDAMEKQGANPKEIQGWIDSLSKTQNNIPKTNFIDKVGEFGSQAGRSIIGAAKNLSSAGEKILQAPMKLLGAKFPQQTAAERLFPKELTRPGITPSEKAGQVLGETLPYLIPTGIEEEIATKGTELTSKLLSKAPSIIQRAAKLIPKAAAGATEFGAKTALLTGDKKQTEDALKIGAILPVLTPAIGKIVGASLKGVREISGKLISNGYEALTRAFNDPKVIQYARKAGLDSEYFTQNIADEFKAGLSKIKDTRAIQYGKQLINVKANTSNLSNIIFNVRDALTKKAQGSFGIKISGGEYGAKTLNNVDFSESNIIKGQDVLQKAIQDVSSWKDTTATGLDTLKKRLGTYIDQLPGKENGPAKSILTDTYNNLKTGLEKSVPGYKKMTEEYSKVSSLIDDITNTFGVGSKNEKQLLMGKLMSSMKDDKFLSRDLLSVIGDVTGKDIINQVAGAQLAPALSPGGSGRLLLGGEAIGALLHPVYIPKLIVGAAMSSPRIMGELFTVLGKVNRTMIKNNAFSQEINQALKAIVLQFTK